MKLRIAFGLLGLLLTGCRDSTSPPGLAVSVKIPAEFRAGESQSVEVTVTNVSSRPHVISAKACPLPMEVYDAAGRLVGPEGVFCTAELRTQELQPGETFTYLFSWSASSLGPGFYTVRGKTWGEDGEVRGESTVIRIIE